jgi:rhodanese-related sulfurtransferase
MTAVVGLLLAAAMWPGPARAGEPFGLLEVDEVERRLSSANVRIFDVNTPEVFARGHLPGAVLVELQSVERSLPKDQTLQLIFYCKNTH